LSSVSNPHQLRKRSASSYRAHEQLQRGAPASAGGPPPRRGTRRRFMIASSAGRLRPPRSTRPGVRFVVPPAAFSCSNLAVSYALMCTKSGGGWRLFGIHCLHCAAPRCARASCLTATALLDPQARASAASPCRRARRRRAASPARSRARRPF